MLIKKRIARVDNSKSPAVIYLHCCEENGYGECRMWTEIVDETEIDFQEYDNKNKPIIKPTGSM